MNIVIRVDPETRKLWKSKISSLIQNANVFLWDEDEFEAKRIDFAIVWAPPSGMLASLPNLRAVFSVGAGISHITDDPTHPSTLPIVRTTGTVLTQRMCEYIALHVLRIHRRLPEIEAASQRQEWKWIVEPTAESRTVGIMGVGNLGTAAAKCLKTLGFNVKGLAQGKKEIPGIKVYAAENLVEFLNGVDILISLLPGTKETENIIRRETIELLPKGAWIINAGRGSQINDEDLIMALDSDHLGGAVLDVFRTEPLPKEHKFWGHKKILITSHTAASIDATVGGEIIAKNIQQFVAGEIPDDIVDLKRGY